MTSKLDIRIYCSLLIHANIYDLYANVTLALRKVENVCTNRVRSFRVWFVGGYALHPKNQGS